MNRIIYIFFLVVVFKTPALCQNGYLDDTTKCAPYFQIINDKDSKLDVCHNAWKFLINNCPDRSKLTYIRGARIFESLVAAETDSLKRHRYLDTLMMNYNLRLKYFGDSSNVLFRKATSIIRYNREDIPTAYNLIKLSIQIDPYDLPLKYMLFMSTSSWLLDRNLMTGSTYEKNLKYSYEQLDTMSIKKPSDDVYKIIEALNKF